MNKTEKYQNRKNKIISLLNEGKIYKEIAYELHLSYSLILSFCHNYGLIKNKELKDDVRNILENYTSYEAAEKLNISLAKVRLLRAKYNINYKHIKNEKHLKIVEDLKKGIKQTEIAAKYNVSRQYINQLKKNYENNNEI